MMEAERVVCVLFDGANIETTFSPEIDMPVLHGLAEKGLFVHSKAVMPPSSGCERHSAFSGSYPSASGFLDKNPCETLLDVACRYGYLTIVSGGWVGDRPSLNSRNSVEVFNAPTLETVSKMYAVEEQKGEFTSSHVIDLACRYIDDNPDFKILFADFLDSDCAGHHHKETSLHYKGALEYEDDQLRRLYRKMEDRQLLDGTLWILLTDHAMVDGHHGGAGAINIWIVLYGDPVPDAASGKETIGTILDICPTVCRALNMRLPERCNAVSLLERMFPRG